jgi:tRNA pseudouridine55 synthase
VKRPVVPSFLVVDKPVGITSHDVVAVVRALMGARKVGHTGTLDPFATGVLVVALGAATRLISFLDENVKVYEGSIQLGSSTATGDPEGDVLETCVVPPLDEPQVQAVLASFVGDKMQTPPPFSAIKVQGRPLYAYARAGEAVEVPARPVRIDSVDLLSLDGNQLRLRVSCGKGTYIRVLAEEIAAALGTVGHLVQLRRLRSGPFDIAQSVDIETLASLAVDDPAAHGGWRRVLRPARGEERVSWLPRDGVRKGLLQHARPASQAFDGLLEVPVGPAEVQVLRNSGVAPPPPSQVQDGERYIVSDASDGWMVALVERRGEVGQPIRVLARPADA